MSDRLSHARAFLLDMDGTFFLGEHLIEGALDFIALLRRQDKGFLFLTNNSSKDRQQYAEKITRLGLPITPDQVLTSGEAAARLLARDYAGAKLFVLGTPSLEAEFRAEGFVLDDPQPEVAVAGFDTALTYAKLWKLCDLVRAGVPYIVTHPDINCPTPDGFMPDIGATIAFVKASTGREPDLVVGKPSRLMAEAAAQKLGLPLESLAVIGDRLYTDIALGLAAGIPSVLVLSGETRAADVSGSPFQPDYVFEHLGALAAWGPFQTSGEMESASERAQSGRQLAGPSDADREQDAEPGGSPLVTFSTLACGEWPAETVIANAARFGYDGLEWRGGAQGHVSPALPAAERQALRRRVAEAGLVSLAVTAYSRFTSPEAAERAAQLDHLRQHLDLAADLGAPYVRTFIGQLPPGRTHAEVLPAVCDCLRAAAEHAAQVGVIVAAESHDDWSRAAAVAEILAAVQHPALRAVWDIGHTFAAGEDPTESLRLLGPHLGYVHVKDGILDGVQWRLTQLGAGQVPLGRVIQGLLAAGYAGGLTVEWERAWHPELDPAETALPAALAVLRQLLADAANLTPPAPQSFDRHGR